MGEIIEQGSHQCWARAREELRKEIHEEIRSSVKSEMQSEIEGLKQYISDELKAVKKEVAVSIGQQHQQKKRWWNFGR
ncbi:hypothetical protein [Alicyclobacillus dauci]|uniref:Uncharacterized protein n=1 Tax=Alicyclobacillus dauci TaxID=1475485 RepID=A0ABY6Z3Q1_9BACL|nr:hypothetical protein [Alicyclobacillus dauci]WAH37258.1 hypothetical protein NZD86_01530 [Alicyclobacillus dauci]